MAIFLHKLKVSQKFLQPELSKATDYRKYGIMTELI